MRGWRALKVCAFAVAIALCAASSAQAAVWNRVTTADLASTNQVGLVRTADGVLHVAWHHPTGPNTEDLLHTVIARNGRIGATAPIQSGWTGFQNTALVRIRGASGCSSAQSARRTRTTRRTS